MITGVVTTDREPILEITVHEIYSRNHQFNAVVDTGYTGWLTMPPAVITALGLPWREHGGATLADGSQVLFSAYNATVVWDGQFVVVPVDEVDADPLMGMSLMYGYELLLPVLDGATFTLRRITLP